MKGNPKVFFYLFFDEMISVKMKSCELLSYIKTNERRVPLKASVTLEICTH